MKKLTVLGISTWLRGARLLVLGRLFRNLPELGPKVESFSFGITDSEGEMYFVQAGRVGVDGAGRLVFRTGAGVATGMAICAVVAAGEWKRVLRGITLDDVKPAGGSGGG